MLIQSNRSALPLHRAFAKSSKQASPGVSTRTGTDKIYVSQNSLAALISTSSLGMSDFGSNCRSSCTACSRDAVNCKYFHALIVYDVSQINPQSSLICSLPGNGVFCLNKSHHSLLCLLSNSALLYACKCNVEKHV